MTSQRPAPHEDDVLAELVAAKQKHARASATATRARAAFRRAVVDAATTDPAKHAWHLYPGPGGSIERVAAAIGATAEAVARMVDSDPRAKR